jgi:6-pyruvoyl-tetrahydropterin synthase
MTEAIKKQIIQIWEKYVNNNKVVQDTKGNVIPEIDKQRQAAIIPLRMIVDNFIENRMGISEFKTAIDSFNKQNNFWGFTSIKGQMFFNVLLKTNTTEEQLQKITAILRQVILEPKNISDALDKIELLENFTLNLYHKAADKRKVPNPNSVGYFLSYFWQIYDYEKWAIMYSSMLFSLAEIGLWEEKKSQKDAYLSFYNINEEIKEILKKHTNKSINNWDAEHAFWNYKPVTAYPKTNKIGIEQIIQKINDVESVTLQTSFDITEYLIPRVAKLVELGGQTDKSSALKGSEYEKLVAEIFKQLDFDVEVLGQGTGRNPDAIVKFREENVAFIIDAKAYTNGYSLGIDDRAIKEYIDHYCPKLKKQGYIKIGFIIVSNSFKSNFDDFINKITWNTEIKRFILLESEALLHLLAYKTKDKLGLASEYNKYWQFN